MQKPSNSEQPKPGNTEEAPVVDDIFGAYASILSGGDDAELADIIEEFSAPADGEPVASEDDTRRPSATTARMPGGKPLGRAA